MTALRRLVARTGRALAHPAVMPGIAIAGAVFVVAMTWFAMRGDALIGYDAHAYYQAAGLDDPYRATINGGFDAVGGLYEYKYPPVLAQALAPLRFVGLPWPAFLGAWTALLLVSLGWLGRRWTLLLLLFPPVLGELWLGNLNILLGAAVVIGMRWPAAWAFIVLTKITPGVGLLWFAARREWRSLAVALAVTAAVAVASFILAPRLWADFLEASRTQLDATVDVPRQAAPIPLPLRLIAAAALVVWGARTNRAWTLPIAVALSVPFLWWNALAAVVGAIPLVGWRPAGTSIAPEAATIPAMTPLV
jgi:Glycosyltransferase family 87